MTKKSATAVLIIPLIWTCAWSQQPLYETENGASLFSDVKARRVGDIVTILIQENTTASSRANTDAGHEQELSGSQGRGVLDFLPLWSFDSKIQYKGNGSTQRQGRIRGEMTAKIVEVLGGSSYRIEGRREVSINGERETIIVSGIIRARDIDALNRVLSTHIADAKITYDGKGVVEKAHQPGFLTKILNWLL